MSPKNLNVSSKTHKLLLDKLKDKRTLQIYKKFENYLNINENFTVAVSGGPDSLALSFLAKIYSIKNFLNIKYFIVDHKLRKNSTSEAKYVQKQLKKFFINSNILTWNGIKPKKNIQSIARKKRYKLLVNESKKFKIKNILLGHHLDDLFENFFIRILRGSGLKGLVSLDQRTQNEKINFIRPLLNFDKKDLIYISKYVFSSFIEDPSNKNDKFKRIKIRNLLKQLEAEGLDKNKFLLTIKNLKFANETIKFYTKKNLEENTTILQKKKSVVIKNIFFQNSTEVVFRSFTEVVKIVGNKYYPTRGKKIDMIIQLINDKSSFKVTLGGCVIKKVNETIIVSKE
ncbi:tRNA lysidine(34) synthetase TilS [Candidatus Pelagibacter bacterium nBUS_30]|uniref:tRNA lysidine(34) synthetase TilS n=1 Tax=Candidatus Pelagibacter bacterium nBUS_30 TaxID=3374191 RepID=UPI003EB8EF76